MNKNIIIALVVGLVVGGLVVWLLMFFAQGTSLGTAVGLSKSGPTPDNWSEDIAAADANHITLKNGGTFQTIDQTSVVAITAHGTHILTCGCDIQNQYCPGNTCKMSGEGLERECTGTCPGGHCGTKCSLQYSWGAPVTLPNGDEEPK